MSELHVDCMMKAANIMRVALGYNNDAEYKDIFNSVAKYLQKHCQHEYETDDFDIDLDTTRTVTYCIKCLCTK